jgi:hypothetical protein
MFHEFFHRYTSCTIDEEFRYGMGIQYSDGRQYSGVSEKVILSRDRQNSSLNQREYAYTGLFSPSSVVIPGALVTTDEFSLFVMTMRRTTERDKSCLMMKTNISVEIQEYRQLYDDFDNPVGDPVFTPVQVGAVGYVEYVSSQLRKEDPGLLPTTRYVLYLHASAEIKPPEETSDPYRIVINGRSYQVDSVDDTKLPNLRYVQLSEDTR